LLAPQEVRDFLRFWSKNNGKSNESDCYKSKQNCGICSVSPNVVQKDALMLRHLNKIFYFRFFIISAHQIFKKKHAHKQFFFFLKILQKFLVSSSSSSLAADDKRSRKRRNRNTTTRPEATTEEETRAARSLARSSQQASSFV